MTIDEKLDFIIEKLQQHDVEFTHLNQDVRDIKLHFENVIDKNINIIGEGHLDLSRKLDNVLMVESEKEMLLIRVNILEDEVKQLKKRIESIA